MLERRRSYLRRALASGAVLAPLGMVPLCLFEIFYVLVFRRPTFDHPTEAAKLVAVLVAVPVGAAALIGPMAAAIMLGITQLAHKLAQQRLAEPKWIARISSVLALPVVAVAAAKMFAGRRAQLLPAKDLLIGAVGLFGLVVVYASVRLAVGVRDRLRIGRWERRHAVLLSCGLVPLGWLLYAIDQRVLVRLYTFFHVGLAIAAVICCQLATAALYSAWRHRSRHLGKLLDPGVAVMVGAVAITLGAWGILQVSSSETLRYLIGENTVLQRKLMMVARGAGLTELPVGMAPELPAQAPASTTMLRDGPRFDDANLVLITVDALRADHMGIYGYGRETTPNIDHWARAEATVFERGYCSVPHTSFSVTSMMTGKRMYSAGGGQHRTIASVLRRYGYKTGGFFPPAVFFIDTKQFSAFAATHYDFEYVKYEFIDAQRRVDQVLEFLRQYGSKKFFIWAHFFEPHEPYDKHPGFDFGRRAIDRYDGEIAYTDRQIARLIGYVKQRYPNTVIALTADHGEAFGEHGTHYHGGSLYDEQIRVPAIIAVPQGKGAFVHGSVQSIDLPATMLGLVDVPIPAEMQGTDLGPWLAGESPMRLPPVLVENDQKKAIIDGTTKLIYDTAHDFRELYDLRSDPSERQNLAGRLGRKAAVLYSELRERMAAPARGRAARDDQAVIALLLDRGRKGDLGAIPGLLKLQATGPVEARREATMLLVDLRARAALPALVKASADSDPGISVPATIGAAWFGDRPSIARIPQLLAKRDLPPALRRDALLIRARQGDRKTAAALVDVLGATDDVYQRIEIVKALGELGDSTAAQALVQQLSTLRVKRHAIIALGLVRARFAVPTLISIMRGDRFISWRLAAARALGLIGDRRAVRPLQVTARHDPEGSVVAEAVEALARFGEPLSVPGLRPLRRRGEWRCSTGSCQLDLGHRCGRAEELVLLLAEAGRRAAIVCGSHTIGGIEPLAELPGQHQSDVPAPGVAIPLAEHDGELLLQANGSPVRLRYAGLRASRATRAPRSAQSGTTAAQSHHSPGQTHRVGRAQRAPRSGETRHTTP